MSAPILSAVESSVRSFMYKGRLGHTYTFSTVIPPRLGVSHGSVLRHKQTEATYFVIGTTADSSTLSSSSAAAASSEIASSAPVELWLHERGRTGATCIKVRSLEEIARDYEALSQVDGAVMMKGPLGVVYPFDTRPEQLEVFGVAPREQYFLKMWNTNVTIVGELCGVLWVQRPEYPGVAMPLGGCTSEGILHTLYGLCQYVHGADSYHPTPNQLIPSPRRATATPRRTGGNNTPAPTVSVDKAKLKATCAGPMGTTLVCDLSPDALSSFGVMHNQRLVSRRGMDAGRFCRVIGVSQGALYVLYDGDANVTCVRNCPDAASVKELFGTSKSDVAAPPPTAATKTPVRGQQHQATPRAAPHQESSPKAQTLGDTHNFGTPTSPRYKGNNRKFWTAFGRLEFDTNDKALAHFGFFHGQVVRATQGPCSGKVFTVVGVRLGNLWVLEDGKQRVTPLSHCSSKEAVAAMFGMKPTGATRDLRAFYELEREPDMTPLQSPRYRLSSPREELDKHREEHSVSPMKLTSSSDHHLAQQSSHYSNDNNTDSSYLESVPPSQSQPQSSGIPTLRLGALTTPSGTGLPRVVEQQQQPSGYGMNNNSRGGILSPAAAEAQRYAQDQDEPQPQYPYEQQGRQLFSNNTTTATTASSSPPLDQPTTGVTVPVEHSARQYLKAYALLKLGHTKATTAPLAFHEYYMRDTVRRVGEAFDRLPKAKALWQHERRQPANFYEASTQEILKFLQERPSVTAY